MRSSGLRPLLMFFCVAYTISHLIMNFNYGEFIIGEYQHLPRTFYLGNFEIDDKEHGQVTWIQYSWWGLTNERTNLYWFNDDDDFEDSDWFYPYDAKLSITNFAKEELGISDAEIDSVYGDLIEESFPFKKLYF